MTTTIVLVSILLAALLGFAAHRASLCTVAAVAEVLMSRRADLLLAFARTALWATAVSLPMLWLWPVQGIAEPAYSLTAAALAGGFLFGVGAALNGGCAFSALARLADGELSMTATLAGFAAVAAAWFLAGAAMPVGPPRPLAPAAATAGLAEVWLLAGLGLWGVWELGRLWRTRLCAERYRLATAALVLGVASGILYTLHGAWAYTTTLKRGVEGLVHGGPGPSPLLLALALAVIAGMVLSSRRRGSFRIRWRGAWLACFAAGMLMGVGGALVPGGNDELILRAIPALSPHALPAYAALLAGVACVLLARRAQAGRSRTAATSTSDLRSRPTSP